MDTKYYLDNKKHSKVTIQTSNNHPNKVLLFIIYHIVLCCIILYFFNVYNIWNDCIVLFCYIISQIDNLNDKLIRSIGYKVELLLKKSTNDKIKLLNNK